MCGSDSTPVPAHDESCINNLTPLPPVRGPFFSSSQRAHVGLIPVTHGDNWPEILICTILPSQVYLCLYCFPPHQNKPCVAESLPDSSLSPENANKGASAFLLFLICCWDVLKPCQVSFCTQTQAWLLKGRQWKSSCLKTDIPQLQ